MAHERSISPGEPPPGARASLEGRWVWLVALIAIALPLWVARDLPMVDLPQHLYVLDVLRRQHDPSTAYAHWFFTSFPASPYLGYYVVVSALSHALPLELANRVFLTGVVVALPLALAFLLRSLDRPRWPALLGGAACTYGDNFAWGLVNTMAGMALALFALGAFARALMRPGQRRSWSLASALLTLATLVMHPVPLPVVAAGSLWFACVLPAPARHGASGSSWSARLPAFLSLAPAAMIALLWWLTLARDVPADEIKVQSSSLITNLRMFPLLLAGQMRDRTDLLGLLIASLLFVAAWIWWWFERPHAAPRSTARQRWALPGFALIVFALYLALPLHLPQIQILNPRFASLAGPLLLASVPSLGPRGERLFGVAALLVPIALAVTLSVGFRAFDREASAWHRLAARLPPRLVIMNLPFDKRSRVVRHAVFLHSAATLARLTGGVPSYCLADWGPSPIHWRRTAPRTYHSEWFTERFDFATQAGDYDAFLLRGASPDSVFAGRLGPMLKVVAHEGDFWLLLQARGTSSTPGLPGLPDRSPANPHAPASRPAAP